MSDFLSRLAVQALGGTPLIRPRLPSRFEPRFEPTVPLAEAESPLVEEAVEAAPEARPSTPPGPHPPAPSPIAPPATGRGGERQEEAGKETVQAKPRVGVDLDGDREVRPAPLPRPGPVPESHPVHVQGAPPVDLPAAPGPVAVFARPSNAVVSLGQDPVPEKPSKAVMERRSESTSTQAVPQVQTDAGRIKPPPRRPDPSLQEDLGKREPIGDIAAKEAPLRHPPLVPRSTVTREEPDLPFSPSPGGKGGDGKGGPGVRSQPAWEGEPADQAPEPTIRVTIGRIEVRATAPAPPPAPAARPAGPRLTLEEYLRRRNEGRM